MHLHRNNSNISTPYLVVQSYRNPAAVPWRGTGSECRQSRSIQLHYISIHSISLQPYKHIDSAGTVTNPLTFGQTMASRSAPPKGTPLRFPRKQSLNRTPYRLRPRDRGYRPWTDSVAASAAARCCSSRSSYCRRRSPHRLHRLHSFRSSIAGVAAVKKATSTTSAATGKDDSRSR